MLHEPANPPTEIGIPIVDIEGFDEYGKDIRIKIYADGTVTGLHGLNRVTSYIRPLVLTALDGDSETCDRLLARHLPNTDKQ